MPAAACPKQPDVRGNEGAIQCDRQRQVDGIPKRELFVDSQFQRYSEELSRGKKHRRGQRVQQWSAPLPFLANECCAVLHWRE